MKKLLLLLLMFATNIFAFEAGLHGSIGIGLLIPSGSTVQQETDYGLNGSLSIKYLPKLTSGSFGYGFTMSIAGTGSYSDYGSQERQDSILHEFNTYTIDGIFLFDTTSKSSSYIVSGIGILSNKLETYYNLNGNLQQGYVSHSSEGTTIIKERNSIVTLGVGYIRDYFYIEPKFTYSFDNTTSPKSYISINVGFFY